MNVWNPTEEYRRIVRANRQYYAGTAARYDATECCVTDARLQLQLENDLDEALRVVGKRLSEVRALDACGGSGNIALKLLRRGVHVTCVDISDDLQQIFRQRCAESGFAARAALAEIGDYLATTAETFDLIIFSSALHHLHSIEPVLAAAFNRLAPGGVVFTTFDPTMRDERSLITRALQWADYMSFKMLRHTGDVPRALARRWRRAVNGVRAADKANAALDESSAGMLAEYHVEQGIDDRALVRHLGAIGCEIVAHRRYVESRYRPFGTAIEWTGDVTHFKLLLRNPRGQDSASGVR